MSLDSGFYRRSITKSRGTGQLSHPMAIVFDGYTRVSCETSSVRVHPFDRAAARRGVCRNLYLGKNQDCLKRCFEVKHGILTMGERMMPMASCMVVWSCG